MANKQRDPGKERFWRRALGQWQSSGLTIRGYCALHDLCEGNFYAWRRELAQRDGAEAGKRKKARMFVPVRVVSEPNASVAGAAIDIELAGGRHVRVGPGFARRDLEEVLAVLEGRSC